MPWISKDYTGRRFGKWEVLKRSQMRPAKYICKCECGEEKSIHLANLLKNASTQCMNCAAKSKSKNDIGKRFNFITILDNPKINGKTRFLIKCDCGTIKYINRKPNQNIYKSCGKCGLTRSIYSLTKGRVGKTYGYLTVLDYSKTTNLFTCKCLCGNVLEVKSYTLYNQMPSCGCYLKNKHIENAEKLVGMKFHRLKVIKFLRMSDGPKKRALYLLRCKCGNEFEQSVSRLRGARSCGCLHKEKMQKDIYSNSELDASQVRALRDLFKSGGYTRKEIAEMFNIKYTNACCIIKGFSWSHIK